MRKASFLIRQAVIRAAIVAAPAATLVACDSLLEAKAPSRVLADNLSSPANAALLVAGARAAFGCAYQAHITGTALLTDEMEDTQLAAAAWDWDRRDWSGAGAYATSACDAGQIFGTYTPLQTARFSAEDAATTIGGFTDAEVTNRGALLAEANLLLGYSRVLIAESYCSAAENLGPELFPGDFFALAEASFGAAITAAQGAGQTNIANAALLGRARARQGLARLPGQAVNTAKYAEAKADAAQVPAGFVYNMPYSSASSYARNNIVQRNRLSLLYSVAVDFRNLNDPRVLVTNSGQRGADAVNTVWLIDKYTDLTTPIPLARYGEAQLIVAEAELAAGNTGAAVTAINNARAAYPGLAPYTGPTDAATLQTLLISERSRELFLEGHRFWDTNRFNLPLNPAAGTPYPGKGGTYADLRCLPLPDVERTNNPNI
ncbi:MAG: RagB/SusD family nutrient uptake outer membrane protein [Gemmatimonadales bacterium]